MRATLPVGLYSPNTAVLQDGTLTLRPLVPEDAAHFETLLGPDADGVAMTSHLPYPLRAAQAREWIVLRTGPGGHVFGVLDAAGRFLGSMGFGGPKDGVPGFGYWIGLPYRNRGFATRAGKLCVAHARSLGVSRMVAETFPGNDASARVLAKLGFRGAGPVDRFYPLRGGDRVLNLHVLDIV
jgi:[ribosomal protein S5]-alanine N-acetyltransferase